jgi:hypothetical protein
MKRNKIYYMQGRSAWMQKYKKSIKALISLEADQALKFHIYSIYTIKLITKLSYAIKDIHASKLIFFVVFMFNFLFFFFSFFFLIFFIFYFYLF